MKKFVYGALLVVLLSAVLPQLAFAQQYGNYPGSTETLEQELVLARKRVEIVNEHPGAGSGTPYLNANGVVGASLISGAVFGGIFVTFVVRAKQVEKIHKTRPVP